MAATAVAATTKKAKIPKEKKTSSSPKASHPTYFEMIKEAILALRERAGSSPYAIAKFVEDNHKAELPGNFKKILSVQLKNCVTNGKLFKVKASYKLSDASKKVEKAAPKSVVEKKPKTPKVAAAAAPKVKALKKSEAVVKKSKAVKPVKKAVTPVKKVVKKAVKSTPVKRKQPKSIKSPAAKKAKKA
ncbi:hypothetical protein ACHQM5_023268 [Ranunculus cassubicifolius]